MDEEKVKMIVKGSMLFWLIGFVMILSVLYMEFFGSYAAIADSTSSKFLMTLKLGGIGFILSGIFLTLIVIIKALTSMPEKLGAIVKR